VLWAVLCGHAPLPKRFCLWAAFCGAVLLTSMLVGCLCGPPSPLPLSAHAFSLPLPWSIRPNLFINYFLTVAQHVKKYLYFHHHLLGWNFFFFFQPILSTSFIKYGLTPQLLTFVSAFFLPILSTFFHSTYMQCNVIYMNVWVHALRSARTLQSSVHLLLPPSHPFFLTFLTFFSYHTVSRCTAM